MKELLEHYGILLSLTDDWKVQSTKQDDEKNILHIYLKDTMSKKVVCPKCGTLSSLHDRAKSRKWRHLSAFQYTAFIHAEIPRCKCGSCGKVSNIDIPWANKSVGFSLLFEDYAVDILQISQSIEASRKFLKIAWASLDEIMKRAVDRGMLRRENDCFTNAGVDEKDFGKGQSYVSLLNDIDQGRVIDLVEGRTKENTDELWKTITKEQRKGIKALAIDMWQAYISSAKENIPDAVIVHDKFHIAGYMNKAVDISRRKENGNLRKENDETLVGTKYNWLTNPENMNEKNAETFELLYKGLMEKDTMIQTDIDKFEELKLKDLNTSKIWAIKENFKNFWQNINEEKGKKFFKKWHSWASTCGEYAMEKVAKMLKSHLPNILTYFKHRITNACSEGLNSKIQTIKSNARGFHSFESYRRRILFFCGKLSMNI